MPSENKSATSITAWYESKEAWMFSLLAAITVVGGVHTGFTIHGILLGFLEIVISVTFWAVRTTSSQMDGFRSDIEKYNKVLAHVGELRNQEVMDHLGAITSSLKKLQAEPVLLNLMCRQLRAVASDFSEIAAGNSMRQWAQWRAKDVQAIFDDYIQALGEECQYDTVSTMAFWSKSNLARPQDFLDSNVEACSKRGVTIRRVFLVREGFVPPPYEAAILRRHKDAIERADGLMQVRIYEVKGADEAPEDYGNFAVCHGANESSFLLDMRYAKDDDKKVFEVLEVVRAPARVRNHMERFERAFRRGVPIEEFKFSSSSTEDSEPGVILECKE